MFIRQLCDECIYKVLNAAKNQLVKEVVIFDTDNKSFYPVSDGTVRIGDYALEIVYGNCGNYDIRIKHIEE